MSRANDAEIKSVEVSEPSYSPYFYFEDGDKEHAVWFLDAVTFLNQVREVRDQKAGGFAIYRLGTEDSAIWDALNVRRDFKIDNQTRESLELLKGTDTIADVGEGEIVTVDETRPTGRERLRSTRKAISPRSTQSSRRFRRCIIKARVVSIRLP